MADEDRTSRVPRIGEDPFDRFEIEAAGKAGVEGDLGAQVTGDDRGGPGGADLWGADDRVRLEPDAGQKAAQAVRLLLALLRQRAEVVRTVPAFRVAGVRVAKEMELGHVGVSVLARAASGMNNRMRSLSLMKTRRKTASRSSSVPVASAGSS